jgi:hypothetical protein
MAKTDIYLRNPNLKSVGVDVSYTKEQMQEYIRCVQDPEYFIENYVKIINVDDGLVPFHMYDYQKLMVNTFKDNRFIICKLPRQAGKSVTVTGYILWVILFQPDQSIAILANKEKLAQDLLGKIRLAYQYLPKWIQQGVVEFNKGSIELENQSKVIAAATSSDAIRGGSYNLVFLDEFAFIGDSIAEAFFSSVYPTISSGKTTKIIIVSTPKGMNHFYKIYTNAVNGLNNYIPIEVHWSDIPGRDEAWKEETIANTSAEQFRQEFEVEFLGSANTLINPKKLQQLAFVNPKSSNEHLAVYEDPVAKHEYVMIVDVSRGVHLDNSAFTVIDITQMPYKLVARYKNNTISPLLYPEIIYNIATTYNKAYVLVEINDIGDQVVDILHHDLQYENILMTTMGGRNGQRVGGGFGKNVSKGVRTTKQVKRIGCSTLKDLVEGNKLIIEDFDTIEELSNFVAVKTSYEADSGHDDLVMCLVLFAWLVKQEYFKEMTNTDFRKQFQEDNEKLIEEDLMPFGFVENGVDYFEQKEEQEKMQSKMNITWGFKGRH